MEFTGFNFHQGDVQGYGINGIPQGAKKVDKQFIAASERSGSFHALFGNYDMYEHGGGFVIDAKEDCILNHSLESELRGSGVSMNEAKEIAKKDHRATKVPKGVYFTGIQQRFNPLSAMRERNKD